MIFMMLNLTANLKEHTSLDMPVKEFLNIRLADMGRPVLNMVSALHGWSSGLNKKEKGVEQQHSSLLPSWGSIVTAASSFCSHAGLKPLELGATQACLPSVALVRRLIPEWRKVVTQCCSVLFAFTLWVMYFFY